MNAPWGTSWGPRLTGLTIAVTVALAMLAWFGYRATREWQRSSARFVERRVDETAELLVTALTRDMRGVQMSVLASRDWNPFSEDSLTDMSDQVAGAFARYPYPESFFGWRAGPDPRMVFFNRANRHPVWMPTGPSADRYPVSLMSETLIAPALFKRIHVDAAAGRRYSIFETRLGNEPYQVVARLQYQGPYREQLENIFGYTVNLDWAARSYFAEITAQVERIGNSGIQLNLAVLDDHERLITGTQAAAPSTMRQFPLLFFDPATVVLDPPPDLGLRNWKVRVSAADDPTVLWATRTADWTLLVITATALTLGVSLIFAFHAVRANVALAELRSDFVSTVTHELKTPLATIRAVGDTLVKGRLTGADALTEYAQLLVQEAKRLTRLVDNLLAYARVTDVTDVYSFERQAPVEIIEDVLEAFNYQLVTGGFDVRIEVPAELPQVRADRTAIHLALDNLIDNAIRYSDTRRCIRVAAWADHSRVYIEVRDRGVGIHPDELGAVQRKFVRGRLTRQSGSGLGLAIVTRVIADHGGRFVLDSAVGAGTTARLDLPAVEG
jgi:signal transduction histidine kinase